MYKATVRALMRHAIDRLNDGDPGLMMKMAASDAVIEFPGENSWSQMFRPVVRGRDPHATHRGVDECRAFAERFVSERIQFVVEDILVNGPPWNTRIALRIHDYKLGPDGADEYTNRAVAFLTVRWGRLTRWEDYEDTERVAMWDATRGHEVSDPSTSAGSEANG
jgi:ketosteroid isomerase-like protein